MRFSSATQSLLSLGGIFATLSFLFCHLMLGTIKSLVTSASANGNFTLSVGDSASNTISQSSTWSPSRVYSTLSNHAADSYSAISSKLKDAAFNSETFIDSLRKVFEEYHRRLTTSPAGTWFGKHLPTKIICTKILGKPKELKLRANYMAEHLPATFAEIAESLQQSIIDSWQVAINPSTSLDSPEEPVCAEEFGVISDGSRITTRFCYKFVKIDGRYVKKPLTYYGVVAPRILQMCKTYARSTIVQLLKFLGFGYTVAGTILYASAYAIMDYNQRFVRARDYIVFVVRKWIQHDFSPSCLVKTALTDLPRAYQNSYNDIRHLVASLYPHANLAIVAGYRAGYQFVSHTISVAHTSLRHITFGLLKLRCARNQTALVCVQDDDWIVPVVLFLIFGILRVSHRRYHSGGSYLCSVITLLWLVPLRAAIRMDLIAVQALLPIYREIILAAISPIALLLGPDHRLAKKCRASVGIRALFLLLECLHYVFQYLAASEEASCRMMDACWEKYNTFFTFETPITPTTMAGGLTDFIDTGVEIPPLVWWSRMIRLIDFSKIFLRLLCTHVVAIPLKWWHTWCKEHLIVRPIDIIGFAVFSLVTRIVLCWKPNVSISRPRVKVSTWMPVIRLPVPRPWIRHTSKLRPAPFTQIIASRFIQSDRVEGEINMGPKVGLAFRELAALFAFAALCLGVYWFYGARLTSCPLAEEEENVDDMLNSADVASESSGDDMPLALAVMQQPIYPGAFNHGYDIYPTHQQRHP